MKYLYRYIDLFIIALQTGLQRANSANQLGIISAHSLATYPITDQIESLNDVTHEDVSCDVHARITFRMVGDAQDAFTIQIWGSISTDGSNISTYYRKFVKCIKKHKNGLSSAYNTKK
jgi:hypothetical protein